MPKSIGMSPRARGADAAVEATKVTTRGPVRAKGLDAATQGAGGGLHVPALRVRPTASAIADPVSAAARADMEARLDDWRARPSDERRSRDGRELLDAWFEQHFGDVAALTPEQAFRVHEYLRGVEAAQGELFAGLVKGISGHLRTYANAWTSLARLLAVPDFDSRPESVTESVRLILQQAFGSFAGASLGRFASGDEMTVAGGEQALTLLDRAIGAAPTRSTERPALLAAAMDVKAFLAVLELADDQALRSGKLAAAAAARGWVKEHGAMLTTDAKARVENLARVLAAKVSAESSRGADAGASDDCWTALFGLQHVAACLSSPELRGLEDIFFGAARTSRHDAHYRVAAECLEALAPALPAQTAAAIGAARGNASPPSA